MTDTDSSTYIPPTIKIIIGSLMINAAPVTAPPRKSEPVSPINTFAGWRLNIRNPISAPISAPEIKFSEGLTKLNATNAKNPATTRVTVDARPSTPSVRFTLFTMPTMRITAKT